MRRFLTSRRIILKQDKRKTRVLKKLNVKKFKPKAARLSNLKRLSTKFSKMNSCSAKYSPKMHYCSRYGRTLRI